MGSDIRGKPPNPMNQPDIWQFEDPNQISIEASEHSIDDAGFS